MAISRKAFTDEVFSTHKAWMLTTQNSYTWPKKWQRAIFRVHVEDDLFTGNKRIAVLPRNPEYQQYMDEVEEGTRPIGLLPKMHLDAAVFDNFEQLEQWIDVLERMDV